jgi:hypothetical protein
MEFWAGDQRLLTRDIGDISIVAPKSEIKSFNEQLEKSLISKLVFENHILFQISGLFFHHPIAGLTMRFPPSGKIVILVQFTVATTITKYRFGAVEYSNAYQSPSKWSVYAHPDSKDRLHSMELARVETEATGGKK